MGCVGVLHSRDAKVDRSDRKSKWAPKHWHHYDTDNIILKPCTHQCVAGSQRYDTLSLLETNQTMGDIFLAWKRHEPRIREE